MGAIHAVQTSTGFEDAVRKTIKAGGCNCSRSFFIGAMLGAKVGIKVFYLWKSLTTKKEQFLIIQRYWIISRSTVKLSLRCFFLCKIRFFEDNPDILCFIRLIWSNVKLYNDRNISTHYINI